MEEKKMIVSARLPKNLFEMFNTYKQENGYTVPELLRKMIRNFFIKEKE